MLISKQITVSGRVQGVYYRVSAKQKAEELNIKGTVKNQSDGAVYIEAEGPESNITEFIAWCHKGPLGAKVQKVEAKDIEAKHFLTFDIIR